MKHRLALFMFGMVLEVFCSSGVLVTADGFLVGEPDFHAVETIEIVAPAEEAKTENVPSVNKPTKTTPAKAQPTQAVTPAPTPVYAEPKNNVKILGKTLEIMDVSNLAVDAGNHVNRYNGKFLYGHNSGAVFGALKNITVGTTFSVMTNGVTKRYKVMQVVIFEKNAQTGRLQIGGSGNYMNPVSKAKHLGVQYDLSIMTCHGKMLPGGDATERLVVFANEI